MIFKLAEVAERSWRRLDGHAVLAAAGYNFSLLLRWFEELLRVLSFILCHALLAAPLHLTRCRKTFFTADYLARARSQSPPLCYARAPSNHSEDRQPTPGRRSIGDAEYGQGHARLMKNASPLTKRASGRSRSMVAKAASISRLVLALRIWICSPMVGAIG
jgi:hypothetical protein